MKRKAFTLIELLVVISIIAMLMAIMMPALGKARNMAATKICSSGMRQISIASSAYASDNNDECVRSITMYNTEDKSGGSNYNYSWVTLPINSGTTKPYTMGSWVGNLPEATNEERIEGIRNGTLFSYYGDPEVLHCPKDKRGSNGSTGGYRTYSISQAFNGEFWNTGFGPVAKRMSGIRRPSERLFCIEEADARGWNYNSWAMNMNYKGFTDPFVYWHDGGFSITFADSHTEVYKIQEKETREWVEQCANDRSGQMIYSPTFAATGDNANKDLVQMRKWYDNFDAFNDTNGW